jgi:co-chaperonin GroES (HSP10)
LILSDSAVRVPLFDPVATWYVLLLPVAVMAETAGGIVLADTTQQAQRVFANVGEVLGLGAAVYQGKTNSGIDMKTMEKPKVGELWAYPQHSGQRFNLRERFASGVTAYQVAVKDSELLGRISPEQFKRLIVWV